MRYSICMLLVALVALSGVSGCKRMKRLKIPPLRDTCHEQRDLICELCGEESKMCERTTWTAGHVGTAGRKAVDECTLTLKYIKNIRAQNPERDPEIDARMDDYFCAATTDDWRWVESDRELTVIDSGGVLRMVDARTTEEVLPPLEWATHDPIRWLEDGEHYLAVELEFDNTRGFRPIDIDKFAYMFHSCDGVAPRSLAIPFDPLPATGLVPVGERVRGNLLYVVPDSCEESHVLLEVYQIGIDGWLRTVGIDSPLEFVRTLYSSALPRFQHSDAAKSP